MADLICIKTYNNRFEANLAKGLLVTNGVEAVVSGDDAGGSYGSIVAFGGIRLLVKEEDVQEALELLKDTNNK